MAYKKPPTSIKSKVASTVVRRDAATARRAVSDKPNITPVHIAEVEKIQLAIDRYNNAEIYAIDPVFKGIHPTKNWVIVRIFHENLIKYVDKSNPGDIQMDFYFRQVDARERSTDVEKWVPTPFPYVEKAMIVAISPEVQLEAYNLKEKLKAFDPIAADAIRIPKVGDIIEIKAFDSSIWFKQNRYYPDKQKQVKDFVRNQNELRLHNFEHYYRFEDLDMTAIIDTPHKGFYADDIEPVWYKDAIKRYDEEMESLEKKLEEMYKIEKDEPENESNMTMYGG